MHLTYTTPDTGSLTVATPSNLTEWRFNISGFPWSMLHAALSTLVAAIFIWFIIRTIIYAIICYRTKAALDALPKGDRPAYSNLVWLLLIPLVPFVWNYFVFPPLAKAYRAYFDKHGGAGTFDCGWGLSLALCICCDATLINFVALPALVGWVVVTIITLVNLQRMRRLVLEMERDNVGLTAAEAAILAKSDIQARSYARTCRIPLLLALGFAFIAVIRFLPWLFEIDRLMVGATPHLTDLSSLLFLILELFGVGFLFFAAREMRKLGGQAGGGYRLTLAQVCAVLMFCSAILLSIAPWLYPLAAKTNFGIQIAMPIALAALMSIYLVALVLFAAIISRSLRQTALRIRPYLKTIFAGATAAMAVILIIQFGFAAATAIAGLPGSNLATGIFLHAALIHGWWGAVQLLESPTASALISLFTAILAFASFGAFLENFQASPASSPAPLTSG